MPNSDSPDNTMKAVLINAYGDADSLQYVDTPIPQPAADEIQIAVHATAVNPIDWKIREGLMAFRYGQDFPKILGFDMAGTVTAKGDKVETFNIGDRVYGRGDVANGGAYAQFNVARAATMASLPTNLDFLEAAAVPLAGITALQGLRDCIELQTKQHILINGACGGVGVFALQIARLLGAQVTAVCRRDKHALAKQLGAHHCIDYTEETVLDGQTRYDAIYDTVGNLLKAAWKQALSDNGIYVTLAPDPEDDDITFFELKESTREPLGCYFVLCEANTADLQQLTDWIDSGQLRIVIDSEFALSEMKAAHQRSESARACGKIVIRVPQ